MRQIVTKLLILVLFISIFIFSYQRYATKKEIGQNTAVETANNIHLNEIKISNELDAFVFNYIIDNSEYLPSKEIKCDESDTQSQFYKFSTDQVDLNNDSVEEYIVYPYEICGEPVTLPNGMGEIYVIRKENKNFSLLAKFYGMPGSVEEEMTDGYRNIRVLQPVSFEQKYDITYKWSKKENKYEIFSIAVLELVDQTYEVKSIIYPDK